MPLLPFAEPRDEAPEREPPAPRRPRSAPLAGAAALVATLAVVSLGRSDPASPAGEPPTGERRRSADADRA
ncbi:MAG: hypothetical protein ACFCGT_14220, partial [Sandaracinaceae bacterium]